jgi:hypothetical protein
MEPMAEADTGEWWLFTLCIRMVAIDSRHAAARHRKIDNLRKTESGSTRMAKHTSLLHWKQFAIVQILGNPGKFTRDSFMKAGQKV